MFHQMFVESKLWNKTLGIQCSAALQPKLKMSTATFQPL